MTEFEFKLRNRCADLVPAFRRIREATDQRNGDLKAAQNYIAYGYVTAQTLREYPHLLGTIGRAPSIVEELDDDAA